MSTLATLSLRSRQIISQLLCQPEFTGTDTFDLEGLSKISHEQLMMVSGVGLKKASRVLREIELVLAGASDLKNCREVGDDFADFFSQETSIFSPDLIDALVNLPLEHDYFSDDFARAATFIAAVNGRAIPTFLDAAGITTSVLQRMKIFSESDIEKLASESSALFQPLLASQFFGLIEHDQVYLMLFFENAAKRELSYSEFQYLCEVPSERISEILSRGQSSWIWFMSKSAQSYCVTLQFIYEFNNGVSHRAIGEKFGCTGENVRRRILRLGVSASSVREQRKQIQAAVDRELRRESRSIRPEVIQYLHEYPGSTRRELCEHFQISLLVLEEALGGQTSLVLDEEFRDGIGQSESDSIQVTRDAAVRALREAADILPKLTAPKYNELLRNGQIQGPSPARIHQVFDTWQEACSIAGVEVGRRGRDHYDRVWSEDDLIEIVAQFLQDPVGGGTVERYDQWREEMGADQMPSVGTIMNYVSRSWKLIRARTLLTLRAEWDVSIS